MKALDNSLNPPLVSNAKRDTLCDAGHPPIRFNCMSTNAGALNSILEECPLCELTARVTEEASMYCSDCDDGVVVRKFIRGEAFSKECDDCGEEMDRVIVIE